MPEYLAAIGKRGGQTSRRELTKTQARQMVAIREAKRAAFKAGNAAKARERWPLNVATERGVRRRLPQIRPRYWMQNSAPL